MNSVKTDPIVQFQDERRLAIDAYKHDAPWKQTSRQWLEHAFRQKYMYNFAWLGRPIIQLPADIVAFQEIVWSVRPDLIIETGIAHGGSLMLSASMLALVDYCEAAERGEMLDPKRPKRRVLGVDIDIRAHNRQALEAHPLIGRVDMIEGSSIAAETVEKVRRATKGFSNILVCLDSNHTHEHVLAELTAYAPMVSQGSYCIVFDTLVEDLPTDTFPDRPWAPGNNPKTALHAYRAHLAKSPGTGLDGKPLHFEVDTAIEDKLLLSVAPGGFLKRL